MKKFKDLSIRTKLIISHGAIIVSTFVFIVILLCSMENISGKMKQLFEGPTHNVSYAGDLYWTQLDIQRGILNVMSGGTSLLPSVEELIEDDVAVMNEAYDYLSTHLMTAKDQALLEEIWSTINNDAAPHRQKVISLLQAGDIEAAKTYNSTNYYPVVKELREMTSEFQASVRNTAEDFAASAEEMARGLIIIGVIVLIVITIIAVLLMMTVTKSLRKPIAQLEHAAEQMTLGNLRTYHEITYESKDELGHLAESLRFTMRTLGDYVDEISAVLLEMAEGDLTKSKVDVTDFRGDFETIKDSIITILKNFNSTLTDIRSAAEQVDMGSEQVSNGAQTLSQGATEQASATEELAATIAEVNSQIHTAGQHAANASEKVNNANQLATACNAQMQELVSAMNDINHSSQEIQKIIKTIEDIAFQTNILALNAAVEAARAGSAGKGFAVVADEVRNLAQKSAEASQNTSSLIEASIHAVNRGMELVGGTAEHLDAVAVASGEIAGMVEQIAQASQEQASSMQQISLGIDQIATVVQTTSATSEESAAASEELSSQAATLRELIRRFRLYKQ